MLRGFRWQIVLLIAAVGLFGIALLLRLLIVPDAPVPAPTPEPTAGAVAEAGPTPTLPPVIVPEALPQGQTLNIWREGLAGQVQRLNPIYVDMNAVDRDLASLIFEGLVTTNGYGEYVPALAEDWLITQDGLEYVFQLRQDILWQDGIPFTAADVMTTLNLLQSESAAVPLALRDFWQTVEVELLDEYTVRFRLAQPLASFLDQVRIGILPAHVFAGISADLLAAHPFNLAPIGTGPYQLERLIPGENGVREVWLRKAPAFTERPEAQDAYALDRLVFRLYTTQDAAAAALVAGEIDALGGVTAGQVMPLEQAGLFSSYITLEPTLGVLIFNWETPRTHAFRDPRVRAALSTGLDRAGLVSRHLSEQAILADSPFIPGSWAYSGMGVWSHYDPIAAQAELAGISFEPPPTPTPEVTEAQAEDETEPESSTEPAAQSGEFTLRLLAVDDPITINVINDVIAQWSLLGLNITPEFVSAAALPDRLASSAFELALVELTFEPDADPDPYAFWHQGQFQIGQNYGGVNDRLSSELLESARRDPNGLHRMDYYTEFERIFAERSLALPLYYPVYRYAVSSNFSGVRLGYLSSHADRFRTIGQWQAVQ